MGIPDEMVVQLVNERIATVDDLVDFDKDTIQQVADSLRRLGGSIPYPTPNAAPGATIPTPPFVFGENSQKRILTAGDIVRYYDTTRRGIATSKISWNTVIKNFEAQWKAIKELNKGRQSRRPQYHQDPASNQGDPVIWVLPKQDHRASRNLLILRRT